MSFGAKYSEIHQKKYTDDKKSSTMDKNAYMTYLEIQLERVTIACSNVEKQNERMDIMTEHTTSMEEKIANLTQLIKLVQSFCENHEKENIKLKEDIEKINNSKGQELLLKKIVFVIVR